MATRTLTDTATITWDEATPNQVKGNVVPGGLAFQPLDSDLTAIAALSPPNDDIIQRKAGAWVNRTMAQLATDLDSSFLTPAEGDALFLTPAEGNALYLPISFTGANNAFNFQNYR